MAAQGMTPEQQALAALQAEMTNTRAQLALVSTRFDQLSAAHTALQGAHDNLHADASRVLNEGADELRALERSIAGLLKKQGCDLLDLKAMAPTQFRGERTEKWRPWARRIKAYCNAKQSGFKKAIEWSEKQHAEITSLSACPWNRAADVDAIFYEFLSQSLAGHAALILDRRELEDRGFEVWRRLHATYLPVGAQYETDMLQNLMDQSPAKDMSKLADAITKFEHDWRMYEQESGDNLSDKFKIALLLKMLPANYYADDLKNRYQQGAISYQQMVDHVLSYNQLLRAEGAFRRGDSDAMDINMVDPVDESETGWQTVAVKNSRTYTQAEFDIYSVGFEDAFAEEPSTNPDELDRPLAAMYRKGFGKGKLTKGKGKGKGGQTGGGNSNKQNTGSGQGAGKGGKTGKGKGRNKVCDYCHKRGHDEKDGCWAKGRGEPRASGPKPQPLASIESDRTHMEASDEVKTGIFRDAGTLDREICAIGFDDDSDSESPGLVIEMDDEEIAGIGDWQTGMREGDRDIDMLSFEKMARFEFDDEEEDVDEIEAIETESKKDKDVPKSNARYFRAELLTDDAGIDDNDEPSSLTRVDRKSVV